MFNVSKIQAGLFGGVGLNQPLDPAFTVLEADVLASSSGLKANDSSFAKLQFLKDSQDYVDISDIQFNEFLRNKQKESILNVCSNVFNKRDLLERDLMFKYAQNKVNTEALPTGFVGYKIEVKECDNIAFELKRVLLSFDGTGDVELILFNTGSNTALKTKTITISSDTQIEELNWRLDNTNLTYKGDYYIGYNTTGLTVQPFKRDYENSSVMTGFDNLRIDKIEVENHNVNTLFDLNSVGSMSEDIGLNLDISVFYDYTELILSNDFLFYQSIYYEFKISILSEIGSSVRHNENRRIGDDILRKITVEIEGIDSEGSIKITGLRPLLKGTLELLKTEIENLTLSYLGNGYSVATLG